MAAQSEINAAGNVPAWLPQFCQLFVDLHRLDWRSLPQERLGLSLDGPFPSIDPMLDSYRRRIEHFQRLEFIPVWEWLRDHRHEVGAEQLAVVHRDFHPFNILISEAGQPFVIDWTAAGVADYRFDLAWTLILIAGFTGQALRDLVLAEYERAAGQQVEALAYFEVWGTLRRLLDVSITILSGSEASGLREGAADLMRQQAESLRQVYRILLSRTGLNVSITEALLGKL